MRQPSSEHPQSWQRLWEQWWHPRADAGRLEVALQDAMTRQPPPVLWLLGKTQSGKTSVIRTLTGRSDADIGSGFRPCTRSSRLYDFPPLSPVVRFLDTRGLGERDYDPAEDLAWCEAQSQLILVVMRAGDTAQAAVVDALRAVRQRHPEWPVLAIQTSLHLTYPAGADHPQPYPFEREDWRTHVPADTSRLIDAQRALFDDLPGSGALQWVCVDLTTPDEDYSPPDYGAEALWRNIEEITTLGLAALLKHDPSVQDVLGAAAHPHIVGAAMGAAALGALPVVDLALLPALQWNMLSMLASIYGVEWNRQTALEFAGLLGTGILLQAALKLGGRTLLKAIPAGGPLAGAVWGASASAALTFALGKAAAVFLQRKREGVPVDTDLLRGVYGEAFARGRTLVAIALKERA